MLKKIIAVCLSILLAISMGGAVSLAETVDANSETDFTFSGGSMPKEVLGNYLSRAVTLQGFCAENNAEDTLFEEDLRMIRRIGAKFIGRAAFYSWGGNMNNEQIENHFEIAEEKASLAHKADSELILQAGVFEIIFKGTVNSTPIPEWVLEEFGQDITDRNFDFYKMLPPEGSKYGVGYWNGDQDTAVPYIGNIETQMYFYYLICRYIDAGYEAVHLGQVELIMNKENERLSDWDRVLTKARVYAKENARRGVVLFDGHRELSSRGLKIGDRMVMDFYSCGGVSHETQVVNGAECAEMLDYQEQNMSWIGRTPGGMHPLGFQTDTAFTLVEFDNFNGTTDGVTPHVKSENDVYCWGYDIITWYAIQPEWYRNQYLLECDNFFKSIYPDADGNQTYFIQPACRRVICPIESDNIKTDYILNDTIDIDSMFAFLKADKIDYEYDAETKALTLTQADNSYYRANYNSSKCITGANQEDTIRSLFLGDDTPEDEELLPNGYQSPTKYGILDEFRIVATGNEKNHSSSVKEYIENEICVGDLEGETKTSAMGDKTVRVLKAGQANVFKIEIDKNAESIQLDDFKIDSADGELYQYHFYLSDDGKDFHIIGSYDGSNGRATREHGDNFTWNNVDEGWIRAQNNEDIVGRAPLNEDGTKKVLYLKVSAKGGNSEDPDDIDENAQISYVSFKVQSVVPATVVEEIKSRKEIIDEFRILTYGNIKDLKSSVKEYLEYELKTDDLQGETKISATGDKTARILKAGQANTFKIEIDKNAESIQLNDFKIDSADGELYQYHFYLSDDGEDFHIIGSYDGSNGRATREHGDNFSWNNVDEGWIRAQNNADIVARAPLNEDGTKKVLYLKLSAKGGNSEIPDDIDENAQISYVSFVVQSVVEREQAAGDLNGDNKADSVDAVLMRKVLLNTASANEIIGSTDVNTDGKTNLKDLVALKKLISGGNVSV